MLLSFLEERDLHRDVKGNLKDLRKKNWSHTGNSENIPRLSSMMTTIFFLSHSSWRDKIKFSIHIHLQTKSRVSHRESHESQLSKETIFTHKQFPRFVVYFFKRWKKNSKKNKSWNMKRAMVRLAKKGEQHERFLNLFMFSENVLEAKQKTHIEKKRDFLPSKQYQTLLFVVA